MTSLKVDPSPSPHYWQRSIVKGTPKENLRQNPLPLCAGDSTRESDGTEGEEDSDKQGGALVHRRPLDMIIGAVLPNLVRGRAAKQLQCLPHAKGAPPCHTAVGMAASASIRALQERKQMAHHEPQQDPYADGGEPDTHTSRPPKPMAFDLHA